MAARTNPSKGGKPDKLFRDALMLEVRRMAKDDEGKSIQNINAIASAIYRVEIYIYFYLNFVSAGPYQYFFVLHC